MDLEWLQSNWAIVASAGGATLLLLIVLFVVIFGRKSKKRTVKAVSETPQSKSRATLTTAGFDHLDRAAASPQLTSSSSAAPKYPPVNIVVDLPRSTPSDWLAVNGEPSMAVAGSGGLRVRPSVGAVSVASAPATPGEVYLCEFHVRLVEPAKNGRPVNFFVGPVMRDSSGAVLNYWSEQPGFGPSETERSGVVEVAAPDGAKTVHIGVHGSWKSDGSEGDGEVEFVRLRVHSK